MAQEAKRSTGHPHEVAVPLLLFTVLGGAAAWSLHLLASYFLVALDCTTGWDGAVLAVAATTLVLAGVALAAGVVAYRAWRRTRGAPQPWDAAISSPRGRNGFLLMMGMILDGLFFLLILLEGLPPFFVPTCA